LAPVGDCPTSVTMGLCLGLAGGVKSQVFKHHYAKTSIYWATMVCWALSWVLASLSHFILTPRWSSISQMKGTKALTEPSWVLEGPRE
jgi:hypothetical protein